MAQVRIRLEVGRRDSGIALATLGKLPEEVQRFLRMVGEDTQLPAFQAGWLATEFEDGSFLFNVESTGEADGEQVQAYQHFITNILSYEPNAKNPPGIRNETIAQYAKMAGSIAADEHLRLGMFDNGSARPREWYTLTKQQSVGILEYFEQLIESTGTIQGILHSLYKETQPPHFDLRELSSEKLIKCNYPNRLYRDVITALEKKDAVVIVQGTIVARRLDRKIDHVSVRRMEVAPTLTTETLEEFFGCAPDFTGDLSTEEYIRQIRGYAD